TLNNKSSERINELEVYSGSGAAPKLSAEEEVTAVPAEFELAQNYPNPFNPSTTINFALPEAVHVRLVLFNVLGEQVDMMVEGFHEAGRHTITYAPRSLPSGVYFYVLQAGEVKLTRRLVLMK
ncbi:MAG: T9SS type A sorting domain-containing protein, partial [candidate division KSB1 bacterium]